MALTRRRSRRLHVEIENIEEVVIKKEVIDEAYGKFYTDRTGLHRVIKCENIDPGQFAIKEEPQESFGFISEIKTENNEELQNSLLGNDSRRKRKRKAVSSDSNSNIILRKKSVNTSQSDENNENIPAKTKTKMPSAESKRSEKPCKDKTKSKKNTLDRILENDKAIDELLRGCILHMKNIEVNKDLDIAINKKFRKRVEGLIPKDMRFPVGNYKCHSCDNDFKLLSDWEDHIILFLQSKGCFPNFKFSNLTGKDSWTVNSDKSFSCNSCDFSTKHKQDVFQHISAKHDPTVFKCALCTKTYNTLQYLRNHLNYKHNPMRAVRQCSFCDYKTIDKYSLQTHERTKHTKVGYLKCDRCNVTVPTKCKMNQHVLKAHSVSVKNTLHKCKECSYVSYKYQHLKDHVKRSHSSDVVYRCDACNYKAYNKTYLEHHIINNHLKDQVEKKFQCDRCEKKFQSEGGLISHNRILHRNTTELFNCKRCDKVFTSKHDMFIHTNVVHLSKPEFLCNECSFWGKNKDEFREHVFKKHRFTFYCALCPFQTHMKLYIYIHMNSRHNPNCKLYKCTECKYVTKNTTLLKQHVNVKHNPNPVMYTCHHCGHQNKIKHKLSQHMQIKHLDSYKKKKQKKVNLQTASKINDASKTSTSKKTTRI